MRNDNRLGPGDVRAGAMARVNSNRRIKSRMAGDVAFRGNNAIA
jgi:hypothetical protein